MAEVSAKHRGKVSENVPPTAPMSGGLKAVLALGGMAILGLTAWNGFLTARSYGKSMCSLYNRF